MSFLDQTYSDLTSLAQVPQYITTGLAQFFGSLASLQFVFEFAPRSGQTLFMALHYLSRAIGSYTVAGYSIALRNSTDDLRFLVILPDENIPCVFL